MSRIIAAVVLCLALTGEVAAQATATGTATATGVGGIQQMEQTGGTQTNQQLMQGDNVNVAAQPVVTPLYPSPLPGTPLNTGGGLPAFVRNVLGHLGNRAVCGSKTYRTFRGELIAVAGKSGKTVIVFTKFAEQQERESQKPNLLLNAIAPAKFTTTPLKNRACVGSLFVVSLAGNKPDGGTVDDDIDEALFSAVRGVDEIEVGYTTLITTESPSGVTIYPTALQMIHRGELFTPPENVAAQPAQKPQVTPPPPPPKAEAPAEVLAS